MFSFFSPKALYFGRGQSAGTASLAAGFGQAILLVHGASATRAAWLKDACTTAGLTLRTLSCANEPSLPDIDAALTELDGFKPDVVIALGGGSVMDFGKALAALIRCDGKPIEYLEVVGDGRPLDVPPISLIALPTTAGTGAEVTKNAVITVPEHGIKVSLRDPRMVPDIAIIDPALMQGAPKAVVLASGLDAVTQVIEPYLCLKANPMTDALCHGAIPKGLGALKAVVEKDATQAWDSLAWVSTCGGLALANAGLGAVHGFAGVIGGKTNAPHGEICGTLLPAVLNSHLAKSEKHSEIGLRLQWVLDQIDGCFGSGTTGSEVAGLRNWSREAGLRGLKEMGLSSGDFAEVAALAAKASSMGANPFALSQPELVQILHDAA
ncbi:iron-containing alcohol dehydrogenase [Sulfitobacter sp. F26204]|uniref:iron-containing alcohol dehydrogenase n=1 Tax=Sulfitobacter sp. F26204 TaxID=2996014 RepID=UPI00225E3365|nr:iron-containing alcohol dehydrogenase [Sulfitobacter sp. F26204]MCX7560478.1 iron-containing alcohol dehydrogenase [Sulfitobacter sp. F26204]